MPRTINNRKIMLISYSERCLNRIKKRFDFSMIYYPSGQSVIASIKTGEVLTEGEIDEIYPTPSELFYSEHAEKKHNYLSNRKSY